MKTQGSKPSVFVLSPRSNRWVLNQFVNDLGLVLGEKIGVLCEAESSLHFYNEEIVQKYDSTFSIQRNDFSSVLKALQENDTLIIPGSYPYINSQSFISLCSELKNKNIKLLTVVFETLAIDEMKEVLLLSDSVVTFDIQDQFTLVRKGISKKSIITALWPLHDAFKNIEKSDAKKNIVIPDVGLGKADFDDIIQAAYSLSELGTDARITVIRTPQIYSSTSADSTFPKDFVDTIELKGLSTKINLIDSGVSLRDFNECISNADVLVLASKSPNSSHERRTICSMAIQARVPVLRAMTTGSSELDDLSVLMTSYRENVIGRSVIDYMTSEPLKAEVCFMMEHFEPVKYWSEAFINNEAQREVSTPIIPEETKEINFEDSPDSLIVLQEPMPRILLKNRSNAFSHPGGDTVVMKQLLSGLELEGFDVRVDLEEKEDVRNYDLVHLFNFAIKEVTEAHSKDCVAKGVPYVVTTLYEDWPKFYNQMAQMYVALDAYVKHGQPADRWMELENAARQVTPSGYWDNSFSAEHAECLLASGENEELSLLRDYPRSKNVMSIPFGCEVSEDRDGGTLFREKFGLENFILCVGRLEWRKNQLMLLKALEDSEDTIVFAASGFTYQPEYANLCKNFKRKGKTIFLERLTAEELASAYQAAKMHVLPSWFELPGLVTIEAGKYGTPVVVSDSGSTRSYVGSYGFYCSPDSAESIRNAVEEAKKVSNRIEIAEHFSAFTWDASVKGHAAMYRDVLSSLSVEKNRNMIELDTPEISPIVLSEALVVEEDSMKLDTDSELINESTLELSYEDICKEGDIALTSGKKELAIECFRNAIKVNPSLPRAVRSLGAAYYYGGNLSEAEPFFAQALDLDPKDVRSMLGKGAVLWDKGDKEKAYILYKQASDMSPGDSSVVLYMVNASYELKKYKELEDSLRNYLRLFPENISIQYCLAGCYFKQEKLSAASGVIERILHMSPGDEPTLELKMEVEKKINALQAIEPAKNIVENNQLGSKIEFVDSTAGTSKSLRLYSGREEIVHLESLKREKKYDDLYKTASRYLNEKDFEEQAHIRILILQAEALGFLGRISEGKNILLDMVSKNMISPRVFSGLGALEASQGNWQIASEYFEKSLEDHPSVDIPLAGMGICARSLEQYEDSWNYFGESLKRNPENVHALLGVIELGYMFNRLEDVESSLRNYLDLKPVDLNMLYSLAGCLFSQGKTKEALSELHNILIFDPEHQNAQELLEKINGGHRNSMEHVSI